MGLFDRLRRSAPPLPIDLESGFWVAEAAALQHAITSIPGVSTRHPAPLAVTLELSTGDDDRVVIAAHNRLVGFAPEDVRAELRALLAASATGRLRAEGQVRLFEDVWRIWAGPAPVAPQRWPSPPADRLPAPEPTIFGIPFGKRPGQPAPAEDGAPAGSTAPTGPAWTLRIGTESWDVHDGVDIDLTRLRARIRDAGPGDTLHLRIWDAPVAIHLDGRTPVTLTPETGEPEVLHPRTDGTTEP